ncbi:MAG: nitrogen regulation protein NR(I) [Saezia sp.]
MSTVWLVDDDQSIRFILEKALAREQLPTRSFKSGKEVLKALAETDEADYPDVLISDIRMPEISGIQLLSTVKELYPQLPVIIMTAYSDLDSTVSAFQGGAFEYIAKPFDLNVMVELVQRAMGEGRHRLVSEKIGAELLGLSGGLIGQAPAMHDVFRAIGRLSQSHVTVLITGESGTGKELVAQALHKHSPRAKGPFIAINTAAIPKDLLENELFGHEKGAFTGAQSMHSGRFEQAAGGTLFLDEIGDMSFDLQTRLLRVLSEGRFYRVGGKDSLESDVRVIAATHQNLEDMVKQGLFREDLFHRLNVIRLRLPSLKERQEDIPLLVKSFLLLSAQQQSVKAKEISGEALDVLTKFSYPGNVRQLENICHWLNVMVPAQVIQVKDLPQDVLHEVLGEETVRAASTLIRGQSSFSATGHAPREPQLQNTAQQNGFVETDANDNPQAWEALLEKEVMKMLHSGDTKIWESLSRCFESCLISTALRETAGKRIEAAGKLGIGRNTITRKIQDLGLDD